MNFSVHRGSPPTAPLHRIWKNKVPRWSSVLSRGKKSCILSVFCTMNWIISPPVSCCSFENSWLLFREEVPGLSMTFLLRFITCWRVCYLVLSQPSLNLYLSLVEFAANKPATVSSDRMVRPAQFNPAFYCTKLGRNHHMLKYFKRLWQN